MDSHRHPASLDEVRALLHAQTLPDPLLDSLRELLSSLEQRRGEGHAVPPAHGEPGAEPLAAEERSQGRMLAQLTAGSRAGDRLRAHQLEERARFALSRILSTSAGEDELSLLFEPVGAFPSPRGIMEPTARVGEPDACAGEKLTPGADADAAPTGLPTASPPAWPPAGSPLAAAAGAVDPASAPVAPAFVPSLPGQSDGSLVGFLRILFAREDLMGLAAAHDSTLQAERTACAEAVLVLLGMPDLLRAVGEGALPYNRLGRLLPKTRLMSLAQLQLLDVFVVGLDRKLSLHRYLSAAQKFISALDGAALTPAQARRERRVVLERHDDGTGSLMLQGPLLLLEALYQRTRGMARAIMRSQISALQCELAGNAAGEADGGTAGDDAAREAAAQTPFGSPAHPGGFDPAHVTALDGRGFG